MCHEKSPPLTSTATGKTSEDLVLEGITITIRIGHLGNRPSQQGPTGGYYAAFSPFLLPLIARRPLSLLRCPSGLDGECFYQRNPGKGLGPDVHAYKFRHYDTTNEYLYIENEAGLLELIQMGAIELHPWGAGIDSIDYPDRLIFDLDPVPEVPFEALKTAARDLRGRLKRKGLSPP